MRVLLEVVFIVIAFTGTAALVSYLLDKNAGAQTDEEKRERRSAGA